MEFSVNHPLIFVLVGVIVAFVLFQSFFFLFRALRRAKELGLEKKKLKKIIVTASIFTVAPAVSIVIGVIVLSQSLGLALPWLRLSVIGSLSYEMVAAGNAESAMGLKLGEIISLSASQYVTIVIVMTVSILVGIWLAPIIGKKLQTGMINLDKRDQKWGAIFQDSLFLGMISAFVGFVFCDFSSVFTGNTAGLIPVLVMLASAIATLLCGLILKKTGWRWVSDYALPISLVLGMAAAIPLTNWLG